VEDRELFNVMVCKEVIITDNPVLFSELVRIGP